MTKLMTVACVVGLALAGGARADFVDTFDSRSTGPYAGQTPVWQYYSNTTGIFESPVVDTSQAFSGTKCLSNANDPASSSEEQRTWMETVAGMPAISGQNMTAEFKFKKTQDWGTYTNQIRFVLEDTASGRKVGVEIRDGKIRDYNGISGETPYVLNAWYKVVLDLGWSGSSYNYYALCSIYDAAGNIINQSFPRVTGEQSLPQVNKVWLLLDSGYTNGTLPRPNNFIDDLRITGMVPEPMTLLLLAAGLLGLKRR